MSLSDTSFEPAAVHDHFLAITKLPHPSANQPGVTGNEDPVREYVVAEAQKMENVEVVFYDRDATEPGNRVIVLRRPGSGSYAGATPMILQGHMDMVYNPVDMEFPLQVVVDPDRPDGKWLTANDLQGQPCTLGADDGIGVATALAILQDENLKEFPIECLFTVQEETDMGGATHCNVNYLTGDKLINLDAETLNMIIFGSAGGSETEYHGTISRIDVPDGYVTRKVSISGLKGGHSGIDINKGRVNAIKALNRTLCRLNSRVTQVEGSEEGIGSYDFLVYDMKRTDVIKSNAIPASVEAVIALPQDKAALFATDFNAYCETLKTQSLPVETGFTYAVEESTVSVLPLDPKSTNALLCMLQQLPTGVISMIPDVPAVVETSTNLYNVALNGDALTMGSSNRSSSEANLIALNDIQVNIAACFGFSAETGINSYPTWEPDASSALLHTTESVYNEIYRGDYEATVIHAGLECGVLVERFKEELSRELEAVSIGPNIEDPHTPRESLEVETSGSTQTVQQFYDAVSQVIIRILS